MQITRYVYRFNDGRFCAGRGATTELLERAKVFRRTNDAKNAAHLVWHCDTGGEVLPVTITLGTAVDTLDVGPQS